MANIILCHPACGKSSLETGTHALTTLQAYVRINTSNPPGDVTRAADFLVDLLKREGIEVKRYESAPGRSIVLARLKGSGSGAKS